MFVVYFSFCFLVVIIVIGLFPWLSVFRGLLVTSIDFEFIVC